MANTSIFMELRSMGLDKQEQTLPGDDDNQPKDTSRISGSAHTNTGTETRRDSVH